MTVTCSSSGKESGSCWSFLAKRADDSATTGVPSAMSGITISGSGTPKISSRRSLKSSGQKRTVRFAFRKGDTTTEAGSDEAVLSIVKASCNSIELSQLSNSSQR